MVYVKSKISLPLSYFYFDKTVPNPSEFIQIIEYQHKKTMAGADLSHNCNNKLVEKKEDARKVFLCRNRF
jgi:hypothetical protein